MATIELTDFEAEARASLPHDALYEIIDGRVVEMPPSGTYPVEVATLLSYHLGDYGRTSGQGRVIIEALSRVDERRSYRPDLAFISYRQWSKGRRSPETQPWEVVPELVVEVVSEHDEAWEILEKVRNYFAAGSKAVWLVYPNLELIHVYDSLTQIRVFTREMEIDGGEVQPGYRLPLSELFEEETEGPAPT